MAFTPVRRPIGLERGLVVAVLRLPFGVEDAFCSENKVHGAAFIEVVALFVAILATTIAFWPRSMAAGILMLPYLGWVAFASVLNFTIWRLNG